MAIPLRNVYYLLCYAWDHLEARELVATDAAHLLGDRAENLVAHVLCQGVQRLARQGLDHGYVGHEVELAGVRGKLLVGDTVKKCLLPAGRTACLVDELTVDVPHNRVLKAAMRRLTSLATVDLILRARLRRQLEYFARVSDVALDAAAFRPVQLHRNIARYGFLLDVCRLLLRSLVPDPSTGEQKFHAFTASDQAMGSLFEDFLFHFFRREQDVLEVSRTKIG
ncbi:MAG: hypothetical protein KC464_07335, partial [Myxococcales bacterium]|nr:hypothetical protein [Myxococcales bacterium]